MHLAYEWKHRSWAWDSVQMESVFAPNIGANQDTAMLGGAMVLLLIVEFGGDIIKAALSLPHRAKSRNDHRISAKPTSVRRLRRPDGSGT
jgi:hypothetical protein